MVEHLVEGEGGVDDVGQDARRRRDPAVPPAQGDGDGRPSSLPQTTTLGAVKPRSMHQWRNPPHAPSASRIRGTRAETHRRKLPSEWTHQLYGVSGGEHQDISAGDGAGAEDLQQPLGRVHHLKPSQRLALRCASLRPVPLQQHRPIAALRDRTQRPLKTSSEPHHPATSENLRRFQFLPPPCSRGREASGACRAESGPAQRQTAPCP